MPIYSHTETQNYFIFKVDADVFFESDIFFFTLFYQGKNILKP